MKKRLMSTLIAGVAVLALLAAVPVALAGTSTDTISIAFARDEPNGAGCALDATEVAGVIPSANWNNETLNTGMDANLVEDVNGVATSSGAHVFWYSTNTWASIGRGETNNNFTGADFKLMQGYLDMQNQNVEVTFIQISNLPASFSGTYDVYVYGLAGVPGRGGIYSVNESGNHGTPGTFQYMVTSGPKDPAKTGNQGLYSGPDYVQAIGDDATLGADGVNTSDFGNYLAWLQVTGPTVTITAINLHTPSITGFDGTNRAAINAVQIVVD